MWSHYANYHTGICLEYDFDELRKMYPNLYLVVYQEKVFCQLAADRNRNIEEGIITKFSDWSYENEWRIIYSSFDYTKIIENEHAGLLKTPKPVGIYLGCKITQDDEKRIKNLCIQNNINLYKMNMKSDKFKLESKEIDL